MKTCTRCHKELPEDSFYKSHDRLHSECKECSRAAAAVYRQTEKYKKVRRAYWDSDKYKEASKKYHRSDKFKAAYKKYKQSSKGRIVNKRALAKFYKTDKGKALKVRNDHARRTTIIAVPATLTLEEWNEIKARYKYKCVYCGQKKPLTRDHIIPVSKGGGLTKENIIPACSSCNTRKHTRPVLLQLLAMVPVR